MLVSTNISVKLFAPVLHIVGRGRAGSNKMSIISRNENMISITDMMNKIMNSEMALAKHKEYLEEGNLYNEKNQKKGGCNKYGDDVPDGEFTETLYYPNKMLEEIGERSRENYYQMRKDLAGMDDLVKYMNHKADAAMDHTNSIFQAQVKKNGYMMGNCRFVGKGKGIHFPEHIWRLIMDFAICDCAVPPEIPKTFKLGRDYQYLNWRDEREGDKYTYIGSTASGLAKFRKKGTTIVKKCKTQKKATYQVMPGEYMNDANKLPYKHDWDSRHSNSGWVCYGNATRILTLLMKGPIREIFQASTRLSGQNEQQRHIQDLKQISFNNWTRSVGDRTYRVDYNQINQTPEDIYNKENLKIYFRHLIHYGLELIKHRYCWLYKKASGDELDACNYENEQVYWDAVFYNMWWENGTNKSMRTNLNCGLDRDEREIAKRNHHLTREDGERISKIILPFLEKIEKRRRKYTRRQPNIQTLKLADKGVVREFFNDNDLDASMIL